MDYNGGAAVSAGLIGGAVMAGVLYTGMAIAPRQIQMDLFHTLGTMLTPRGGVAVVYMAGAVAHALFSLIIGLVYALLFLPFADGTNVVGWGVLYGFVHWVIIGGSLELLGRAHPLMRSQELRRPGVFAMNYPRMTVAGFLALHLIFGLIVGGIYTAST